MNMKPLLCAGMLVALSACGSDGNVRPPQITVNVFNAASNLEAFGIFREEQAFGASFQDASLTYSESATHRIDSGQYDFHVEVATAATLIPERLLSVDLTLAANLEYTFVVTAPGGLPELQVIDTDAEPAGDTVTRITLIHAFHNLGSVDVYMQPAGTSLTSVAPQGQISFGETDLTFDLTPDTYHIFLTPAGNPNDVLFESVNLTFDGGSRGIFVVSDPGNRGNYDIQVSSVTGNIPRIEQEGLQTSVRVIQTIDDRLDRDVYVDDTLAAPLITNAAFGAVPAYSDVSPAANDIILTQAGNPGTEEARQAFPSFAGFYYTILFSGDLTNGISAQVITEDRRSITGQATMRLLNGAGLFEFVNVFIEPPGTDIATEDPSIQFSAPGFSNRLGLAPGDFEITVQDDATDTILAGPAPFTVEDGGYYGILLLNSADGSTIDVSLFDDFIP